MRALRTVTKWNGGGSGRRTPLQRVVEDLGDEGAHAEVLGSRAPANLPLEALVERYGISHDAENN